MDLQGDNAYAAPKGCIKETSNDKQPLIDLRNLPVLYKSFI